MTRLVRTPDTAPQTPTLDTTDAARITATLAEIGVRFERWPTRAPLPDSTDSDRILLVYAPDIERLKQEGGYTAVDVVRLSPDHPDRKALRQKFLSEHTHSEDEVRFFVEGSGLFYLRVSGEVFAVRCEAGDLISVPAGVTHWFDMGESPRFTAIRLFTNPEGWIAHFTGDTVANRFPRYESYL